MNPDAPLVVLFGAGVTVLGAIRSLARTGRRPWVVTDDPTAFGRSRWCRLAPPVGERPLADYLASLSSGPPVLIPCSDHWTSSIGNFVAEGGACHASVARPEVLAILLDKGRFARHLQAADIPHPRTVVLNGTAGDLPIEYRPGLFIKPRDSQSFVRTFGVKALFPGSRVELEAQLEVLGREGCEVILQEYVPGPSSNHYFVDGFIDRTGSVRGLLARRRLRMYPPRFGNSSYMVSVPLSEARGAVDAVVELLTGLGYRGIFSAEFKKDERDGVFRILEVNARPWWFVEFAARCGLNVMDMAYRDALGEPVRDVHEYQVGRRLVHPYYDAQACWGLVRSGELPVGGWLRSWIGADYPVFSWRDPLPALVGSARFLRDFSIRRLRGRRRPRP